jgi:hypothetical protein
MIPGFIPISLSSPETRFGNALSVAAFRIFSSIPHLPKSLPNITVFELISAISSGTLCALVSQTSRSSISTFDVDRNISHHPPQGGP